MLNASEKSSTVDLRYTDVTTFIERCFMKKSFGFGAVLFLSTLFTCACGDARELEAWLRTVSERSHGETQSKKPTGTGPQEPLPPRGRPRVDPASLISVKTTVSGGSTKLLFSAPPSFVYWGPCSVKMTPVEDGVDVENARWEDSLLFGLFPNGYFVDDSYFPAPKWGFEGCDTLYTADLNGMEVFIPTAYFTMEGERAVGGEGEVKAPVFVERHVRQVRVSFEFSSDRNRPSENWPTYSRVFTQEVADF
jgi:hypothetical protein